MPLRKIRKQRVIYNTRMIMDVKVEGRGCMTRLLGKAMSGMFKKVMQKDWGALNEHLKSKLAV